MDRQILDTDQKALELNLDERIYGTFAEIGAGQEVARIFFKVGAAAGTIAKTMSAYDKTYSDAIYGREPSGRYVCEPRLYKMLDKEFRLLVSRLGQVRPNTTFFVFADTVAAINYQKTTKGHGWLGVRFQLNPEGPANDIVLHAKMLDQDNQTQQSAIGVLGVNLLYACYKYPGDLETFVKSLMDSLHGRIEIDFIRLSGGDFKDIDNRLLGLYLVKHHLSEVSIFGPDKESVHGSSFLYKKALMVVRGNYRPPTKVSEDVFISGFKQFIEEPGIDPDKAYQMAELTLDNLKIDGEIDENDFLHRADLLNEMGKTVIISNCHNHQRLINYLSDFKIQQLGLVIGARELLEIINEKYINNLDGRLLVAFGELFTRNIKIYVYPVLKDGKLIHANNLPVPEGIKFLYKYLLENQHVVEIDDYNAELLPIFPQNVLAMITQGEPGWEAFLPEGLSTLIKANNMFGHNENINT